jgi:small multidrug resistance family-3 protein
MSLLDILRSISIFILAGLCEIGGGYLVWIALREGKGPWWCAAGGIVLAIYGVVATFQPANFGRTYAAYGGIFIAMAIVWGWGVDKRMPDRYDLIGGVIAILGAGIIMYWPRK